MIINSSAAIQQLRLAIKAALAPVEAQFGVTVDFGKVLYQFDGKTTTMPLICTANAADGTPVDREKEQFALYAPSFGLKAEHYGKTFMSRGTAYTVCGIKEKSFKYPVIGRSERGTRYKFSAEEVLSGLAEKKEKA